MAFMRLSNILRRKRGRPEHLKEMPVGNILTVSWFEVEKTAALYGAIGLFHYVLPKKIPTDLDGSRSGRSRASRRGFGTSCSTRPLVLW
jgi:hypothetical protein